MNSTLKTFAVFKNQLIGEIVKAKDFNDLLENRMNTKQKKFWSEIRFYDEEGNSIQIMKEYLQSIKRRN